MNSSAFPPSVSALFVLLRSGLWEREADDLSPFPLAPEAWEEVLRLSRQQTVTGLVFRGVCLLPERLLPPEGVLLRFVAEADAVERAGRRMNRALGSLYGRFTAEGLTPVLQKGQACAACYERPLLRSCGDIDLCFPDAGAFRQAASLAGAWGCAPGREADGSLHYTWEGVCVEHHPRLLDLSDPLRRRYLSRLQEREGYTGLALPAGAGEEVTVTVPSPLLTLLLLNAHILKHALGWGIGLRQCCDLARACHRLRAGVEDAAWEEALRRSGLARWSRLLHGFLQEQLGLPAACLPAGLTPLPSGELTRLVLRGGNFGRNLAERNRKDETFLRRKAATARSFLRNTAFALRYAPQEAVWTFAGLAGGQFARS